MARGVFAVEIETRVRTPEGGERTKSVRLRLAAIAISVGAVLLIAGAINAGDIIGFFATFPSGLLR